MATAAESECQHKHLLEERKRKALIAILADKVEDLVSVIEEARAERCGSCNLMTLLGNVQTFRPVGKEHNQNLLRVLSDLLWPRLPRLPENDDQKDDDKLLDLYLEKYRGQLSHIAAFLGRTEIVKAMTSVVFTHRPLKLFESRDSTQRTALMLAVQGYHPKTIKMITDFLQKVTTPPTFRTVARIIKETVAKYSHQISYDPYLQPALETLFSETAGRFYELYKQDVSVMWHIACRNLRNISQILRWDCVSCKTGTNTELHPLHYAVALYSMEALTDLEERILKSLIKKCSNCSSLNYINRWQLPTERGSREMISGTVVHFALQSYSPRAMWQQINPGFDDQNRPRPVSDPIPGRMEGPNNPHVLMLNFLHSQGADMSKPNDYNKRPYDLLPPDADPYLFHVLKNPVDNTGEKNERTKEKVKEQ